MAGETDGGASLIDPSGHAQAVSQAVPLFDDTVRSLSVRTWRPPVPTEVGFNLAGETPPVDQLAGHRPPSLRSIRISYDAGAVDQSRHARRRAEVKHAGRLVVVWGRAGFQS